MRLTAPCAVAHNAPRAASGLPGRGAVFPTPTTLRRKEQHMKKSAIAILFSTLALASLGVSAADPTKVELNLEGCKKDLETYCKNVTLGEGRVLACMYAYEDQLSEQCVNTLYDAAAKLDKAISTLETVANACGKDIDANCAHLKPGKGRIAQCLKDAGSKVSKGCTQALKDTGLAK
jgi:hypothetical protein